jgi:plastocyanin
MRRLALAVLATVSVCACGGSSEDQSDATTADVAPARFDASVPLDASSTAFEDAASQAHDTGQMAATDTGAAATPDTGTTAGADATSVAGPDATQLPGPDAAQVAGVDSGGTAGADAAPVAGLDATEVAGPDAAQIAGPDAAPVAGPDAAQSAGPDAAVAGPDASYPTCATAFAGCSSYVDATGSGANRTISFTCCQYSPKCMKVLAGQSVTFSGSFSTHPLHQSCGPSLAIDTTAAGSTASFVFDTPGEYGFYCSVHGTPEGAGMAGSILVQ